MVQQQHPYYHGNQAQITVHGQNNQYQNQYQVPQNQYQVPQNQYQMPQNQYQVPQNQYVQQRSGNIPPAPMFQQPNLEYQSVPQSTPNNYNTNNQNSQNVGVSMGLDSLVDSKPKPDPIPPVPSVGYQTKKSKLQGAFLDSEQKYINPALEVEDNIQVTGPASANVKIESNVGGNAGGSMGVNVGASSDLTKTATYGFNFGGNVQGNTGVNSGVSIEGNVINNKV